MMLIDDKPLPLPPYSERVPVEYSARCFCGARYLVFSPDTPGIVGDAEGKVRERAAQLVARFVDVRVEPFVMCTCGAALDFSTDKPYWLVM